MFYSLKFLAILTKCVFTIDCRFRKLIFVTEEKQLQCKNLLLRFMEKFQEWDSGVVERVPNEISMDQALSWTDTNDLFTDLEDPIEPVIATEENIRCKLERELNTYLAARISVGMKIRY